MKKDEGNSDVFGKLALGLGLTVLPALLIGAMWIASATDREPIWQLAFQLALLVVGGCLAVIVLLMARDRAAARGVSPERMNRWAAIGMVAVLAVAALIWRFFARG